MKLATLRGGETDVVLRKVRHTPGADNLTVQCSRVDEIRLDKVDIIEGYDHVRYIRLQRGDLLPIYSNSDWEWENASPDARTEPPDTEH